MIRDFSLDELRTMLSAELLGPNLTISGVSTDTRTVAPGDLFIALRGGRFDGHDYIAEAEARGAAAIVAERPCEAEVPVLLVASTRVALGQIAAFNRSLFAGPLIAVTGSNGKTTVKELLRKVFLQQGPVLATQGNLNNEIGAPLTLLQLAPAHAAAVVELGASGPGEIAWTASLAVPLISIITNAGEAHMAGFGSHAGLVSAKGEIVDETAANGAVVLNFDDPACDRWRKRAGTRTVITVSAAGSDGADIRADSITETDAGLQFRACFAAAGNIEISLPLIGAHNVSNALLAIAAASAARVGLDAIKEGLAAAEPVRGRMQNLNLGPNLSVIDDSYNANPTAMRAALRALASRPGLSVAVVGDMAELGGDEAAQHREIGALAQRLGIERLYAIGQHANAYIAGFGSGAKTAQSHDKLVDLLWVDLFAGGQPGSATILVKGSRSAQMDQVVALIREKVKV